MDGWDAAAAKATKILGDKAKIPKPKAAIDKGIADSMKAWDAFAKAREDLEAKILALVNADSAAVNAIEQFRDTIDENDLGLDKKNKDDSKKIADGKKILLDFLDAGLKNAQDNMKNERDLNKHLANIKNYKQSA